MVQAASQQCVCSCDCACAEPPEPEPLLLDTNVLSALARLATCVAAAGGEGTAEEVFRALLAAVSCCGQRRLLLSKAQLLHEIEGGKQAPLQYAVLDPCIFRELFQLYDGTPEPDWEAEHDGDTDRAILASAVAVGGPVTIVTVDLKFCEWVNRTSRHGHIGEVTAMDGMELLGRITACLALSEDLFSACAERERAFLDERVQDPNDTYDEARATLRRKSWRSLETEVMWRLQRAEREGGRPWVL